MKLTLPLCLVALAACGFHLRGTGQQLVQLPPVFLTSSSYRESDFALADGLSQIGALAADRGSAGRVELVREQLRRRPLATAGQGSATHYELRLELTYRFYVGGQGVESEQSNTREGGVTRSVYAERNYEFDVNNLATNSQEEELLMTEMRRELAGQIVRQLAAMQESSVER